VGMGRSQVDAPWLKIPQGAHGVSRDSISNGGPAGARGHVKVRVCGQRVSAPSTNRSSVPSGQATTQTATEYRLCHLLRATADDVGQPRSYCLQERTPVAIAIER
jgi:hypothetical protein